MKAYLYKLKPACTRVKLSKKLICFSMKTALTTCSPSRL